MLYHGIAIVFMWDKYTFGGTSKHDSLLFLQDKCLLRVSVEPCSCGLAFYDNYQSNQIFDGLWSPEIWITSPTKDLTVSGLQVGRKTLVGTYYFLIYKE